MDFGAGPVIHRLFSFVPYVNKIYIAEYLPESLAEIKRWKKSHIKSRNWDFYIKKILSIENKTVTQNIIIKRREQLKNKIFKLLIGDAFRKKPLRRDYQFPLVTSFYCVDAITDSKKVWFKLMENLSSLVSPNGWLIISALRNTDHSFLGNKKMINVKLNERDMKLALSKLGFEDSTIDIKVINAKMWSDFGVTSVMIAKAQKSRSNINENR